QLSLINNMKLVLLASLPLALAKIQWNTNDGWSAPSTLSSNCRQRDGWQYFCGVLDEPKPEIVAALHQGRPADSCMLADYHFSTCTWLGVTGM
ncbi:hypothetical protein IAQ61_006052, partial [Plenodomus lingam]|uniref:uncharacterized protein n=1 Tax=Leptosphaeria maculans TaxID=5022 RepID=UPI003327A6F1